MYGLYLEKFAYPYRYAGWAADAWAWAKLNGLNDGTRPKDNTTREEVASFLYNFYYKFVKAR